MRDKNNAVIDTSSNVKGWINYDEWVAMKSWEKNASAELKKKMEADFEKLWAIEGEAMAKRISNR